MAVDWIKMRTDLQTHRKVRRIASALNTDKFRAIGLLHAVWSIFDAHSVDGSLDDFTPDELDEDVGVPGVARAMEGVGWLTVGEDVLSLPDFDEHNGQSAKRRATEARRKKKTRKSSAARPQPVRETSAPYADKVRTREEKRREEERREEEEASSLQATPSTPEWPLGGVDAMDFLQKVCETIAPGLTPPDDFTVSVWLRDLCPNPYWHAAALCEAQQWLVEEARGTRAFDGLVRRRHAEGWQPEGDPKGYVEFRLSRAAAVLEMIAQHANGVPA